MFRRLAVMVFAALVAFASPPAFADEDCAADCPDGKIRSSFLDGQHVTCMCVEPGAGMDPDPADASPPSGGEGQEGEG